MQKIAILGSSGSIGVNTLEVVRHLKDQFKVTALSVHSRIDILEAQIAEFKPEAVCVVDKAAAAVLKGKVGSSVKVFSGEDGLIRLASEVIYDVFVGAMVGFSGLAPTIEAIYRGKRIALANKETLVAAGELITGLCNQYDAEIIPVDSEHSAIFQCLIGEKVKEIRKIILTASGGPFFKFSKEELDKVTIEQALKHPTWKMGAKITIDSATLMNKGLELIEARWLFSLPAEKLGVVVHPQSIIHSMIEFIDGSVKAQISVPDMKLPIQYALTYPNRVESSYIKNDFPLIGTLNFFEPDINKFDCLKIAYETLAIGGTAPCIANAANEIAVQKFLNREIGFTDIPGFIRKCLDKITVQKSPDLSIVFETDKKTRELAQSLH
jgi:1-deoxy-D-xylulose-5-phosphate reductoisomerase